MIAPADIRRFCVPKANCTNINDKPNTQLFDERFCSSSTLLEFGEATKYMNGTKEQKKIYERKSSSHFSFQFTIVTFSCMFYNGNMSFSHGKFLSMGKHWVSSIQTGLERMKINSRRFSTRWCFKKDVGMRFLMQAMVYR